MDQKLKFAKNLAAKSGQKIVKGLGNLKVVKHKDIRDIALNLDYQIEKFIVAELTKKFPQHNIIMEEGQQINNKSDFTWIIDPIDGTKYLKNGIKMYNVSIGLWYKNKPFLGVVYDPNSKDCYWAEKGKGSFFNGTRLHVSKVNKIAKAMIALDINNMHKLNQPERNIFEKSLLKITRNFYRFRCFGSGTLPLSFLAQGHLDALFDLTGQQNFYDLGASLVIAQEAGAKITDLDGKFPSMDCSNILVTNGLIHQQVLKVLKK